MQVDTIYNIKLNVLLYHILHIRSGDIYGTESEIVTKTLSVINTVSAYESSSTNNRLICIYKESVHSTYT